MTMNKNYNIILAGFGGQGVLFAGKVIAYAGLLEGKELSWLPSYGPEMRGGTANCSVCISDEKIGSPLVTSPNAFVAMNLPSFRKFIGSVQSGGVVIIDSSLINERVSRRDISVFYIPATKIAEENDLNGFANMIIVGKLFKEIKFCQKESLYKGLKKCISGEKAALVEKNEKAINLGIIYK